jgi:hypothetical protein
VVWECNKPRWSIARISHPTDVSRVCAFMGLANYCHRYVKGFNVMVKFLNMLLKLDQKWQWGDVATLLWPSVGVKPNTWKK